MEGFEPPHALRRLPDFESGPFSHLGTSPYLRFRAARAGRHPLLLCHILLPLASPFPFFRAGGAVPLANLCHRAYIEEKRLGRLAYGTPRHAGDVFLP